MKFTKGNTTVTLDKLYYLQKSHASTAAQTMSDSFQFQMYPQVLTYVREHNNAMDEYRVECLVFESPANPEIANEYPIL